MKSHGVAAIIIQTESSGVTLLNVHIIAGVDSTTTFRTFVCNFWVVSCIYTHQSSD